MITISKTFGKKDEGQSEESIVRQDSGFILLNPILLGRGAKLRNRDADEIGVKGVNS